MPPTLETERLRLVPTQVADAAFLYRLMNSPGWLRYIGDRQVDSPTAARQYIELRILPQIAQQGYGSFTLVCKHNHTKIGVCGLYDRPGVEGPDLGFALLPSCTGQGYAYEAARRLMQAARDTFNLAQLKAVTLTDNKRSHALLQKLGFQEVGTFHLPQDPDLSLLWTVDLDTVGIE